MPDASALMAVAFGLLDADDPRSGRLVDALIDRLGSGPDRAVGQQRVHRRHRILRKDIEPQEYERITAVTYIGYHGQQAGRPRRCPASDVTASDVLQPPSR